MKNYSPLRYPGGKKVLTNYVKAILKDNNITGTYCEPYAGGASIAIDLLLNNCVDNIVINDIDLGIYSFWHYSIKYPYSLIKKIKSAKFTIDEWRIQKEIYKTAKKHSLKLAYATLYLNKTNRSGILKGGAIGGIKQNGNYKMDCRFNMDETIKKIKAIAKLKNRIRITNLDAEEFINNEILKNIDPANSLIFFDPPYVSQGGNLYTNYYRKEDHMHLKNAISNLNNYNWIVTYDKNELIKELYKEYRTKTYFLNYSAETKRLGEEIIVYSSKLAIPSVPITNINSEKYQE